MLDGQNAELLRNRKTGNEDANASSDKIMLTNNVQNTPSHGKINGYGHDVDE